MTQVEECAGDGVCKPPTRFQYQSSAPGFEERATSIAAPTSLRASPMLFDIDGDGLDDLVVPDTNAALSTPENPITEWLVARNDGPSASPPYFSHRQLGLLRGMACGRRPLRARRSRADPARARHGHRL